MSNPTPRRIEWAGPSGWSVFADEDGVHVRSSSISSLEQPEVEQLVAIWQQARDAMTADHVPAPKVPTVEDRRAMAGEWSEKANARRAQRAIAREFDPDNDDSPF